MKNIFLLRTDKPSRLIKNNHSQLLLTIQTLPLDRELGCFPQHIYITDNEKIKLDFKGWFIGQGGFHKKCVNAEIINNELYLVDYLGNTDRAIWCRKIIIASDTDLIADGIQEISEDFLQWFVQNSDCESVEVSYNNCENCINLQGQELSPDCCHNYQYKK
jgi:hypothetical protein